MNWVFLLHYLKYNEAGLNWSYGCTRFLIAHCYQSGRSHSPLSVPVDSIVVALALTGFVTESIKFTFLPSLHPPPPPKDSFCSGLLIWIYLWKGLISAEVWCVRVGSVARGKLAGKNCVWWWQMRSVGCEATVQLWTGAAGTQTRLLTLT